MKKAQVFGILLFSCVVIFLFSNGQRISHRHLGQSPWYLDHKTDSGGFFSADTLRFFTPYPMWKIVVGDTGDTLSGYPHMEFGNYDKDEFEIGSLKTRKEYRGLYKASNKTQTLILDLYKEGKIPSDDIHDWDPKSSVKYHVLEFSKSNLVLVKVVK